MKASIGKNGSQKGSGLGFKRQNCATTISHMSTNPTCNMRASVIMMENYCLMSNRNSDYFSATEMQSITLALWIFDFTDALAGCPGFTYDFLCLGLWQCIHFLTSVTIRWKNGRTIFAFQAKITTFKKCKRHLAHLHN